MPRLHTRQDRRRARHMRVRQKVRGTPERLRLSVFRSLKQIYAQVIDDTVGQTLASASSLKLEDSAVGTKTAKAQQVGAEIARRAQEVGITRVVFDRGGYKYQGRIEALAKAAREGGLEF